MLAIKSTQQGNANAIVLRCEEQDPFKVNTLSWYRDAHLVYLALMSQKSIKVSRKHVESCK